MKLTIQLFSLIIIFSLKGYAQVSLETLKKDLTYYLPNITYDKNITTPEQYFGFQIGEWHVSHDQVVGYMKTLDRESNKVELREYARSHENRQLLTLYISSEENIKNKDEIKQRHMALTEDGNASIENLPLVLYQGYSIHGNEPSGINAAMMVAYYLVAGQSEEVKNLLNNAFIIFDPCYNPDGVTRFSTWANSHKGMNLISDPISREYNEMWPGGRTNHYWFDLNRDWLLLTHPESRGRVKHFQEWLPNILTDHHEMGTNSTFFFQPGVPTRVNPNTPKINQELTEEIATYHAKALDEIGSLYYSKEGFDDYYFGKGSTYPDIQGGIGILFEQASSRGHYQESVNGILTFPFTIRNQVVTSLSTQKAAVGMHKKLLEYKKASYKNLADLKKTNPIKAYIFTDSDKGKLNQMIDILLHHKVKMFYSKNEVVINKRKYAENSVFVPLDQKQYKLVKTCFEKVRSFEDSIFYDVSAWTLPLAFDVQYDELDAQNFSKISTREEIEKTPSISVADLKDLDAYGFAIPWNQVYSAAFLEALLENKIIAKTVTDNTNINKETIKAGSIIVSLAEQTLDKNMVIELMNQNARKYSIKINALKTGYNTDGLSLGHPDVVSLEELKAFSIIGQGVSSYEAGELWHYMDHRLHEAITLIDKKDLSKIDLDKYNSLILVEGSYNDLTESFVKNLESWVRKGNKIIALSNSVEFLKNKSLIQLENIEEPKKSDAALNYKNADEKRGAQVLGGSIFNTEVDLSHPLCFGLDDSELSVFKQGTTIYKPTNNPTATPIRYAKTNTIQSGYIPQGFDQKLKGQAAATIHSLGNGSIVCFMDNVLFRGYWWGGFRVFSNALYFMKAVDKNTKESK